MRRALERDLHNALANHEFELHYQPVVDLDSGEICICEALLRWNHPKRGRIPPLEFIPVLEASGLIIPVGEWILQQACAEAATWPVPIRVAVNASAVQFISPGFVRQVAQILQRSGLTGTRLELELTESVLLDDSQRTLAELHELHALGVKIALDDFGTGYSSLSYLSSFPFNKIKIDRCFIQKLSKTDTNARAIVRAVTRLGASLGIETTAEGVETLEHLDIVRAEGCTSAQGYFFHPPLPSTQIKLLLSQSVDAPGHLTVPNRDAWRPAADEEGRLCALHQYDIMDTRPEETFDRITRLAKTVMEAPVAMISLVDRDRQWFKSRIGTDIEETPRDISFCAYTIESDVPLIVADALKDSRFCNSPLVTGPDGVRAYVGVPLRTSTGHRIGALCINDVKPREVTRSQLDCLQDLARLAINELELRKLATVDSLTGAATARVFLSTGETEFQRARRQHHELACIAFDLDYFTRINDAHGHAAGDQALAEVVTLCRAFIRSTTLIGHLSGEEFAILLPDTTTAAAAKMAEGLRESIALHVVSYSDQRIRLTASFGVTSLLPEDRSFKSLLARADVALYEAKVGGRNKVVTQTSPLPVGSVVAHRYTA